MLCTVTGAGLDKVKHGSFSFKKKSCSKFWANCNCMLQLLPFYCFLWCSLRLMIWSPFSIFLNGAGLKVLGIVLKKHFKLQHSSKRNYLLRKWHPELHRLPVAEEHTLFTFLLNLPQCSSKQYFFSDKINFWMFTVVTCLLLTETELQCKMLQTDRSVSILWLIIMNLWLDTNVSIHSLIFTLCNLISCFTEQN